MKLSQRVHEWSSRRSELRRARRECLRDMARRDVSRLDMRDEWTPERLDRLAAMLRDEAPGDDDA